MVLGPALRTDGERATGVVKFAERLQLSITGAVPTENWRIVLEVTPRDRQPYTAELVIAFSTPERAAGLTRIGVALPLFYDPLHPQTYCRGCAGFGLRGSLAPGSNSRMPLIQ